MLQRCQIRDIKRINIETLQPAKILNTSVTTCNYNGVSSLKKRQFWSRCLGDTLQAWQKCWSLVRVLWTVSKFQSGYRPCWLSIITSPTYPRIHCTSVTNHLFEEVMTTAGDEMSDTRASRFISTEQPTEHMSNNQGASKLSHCFQQGKLSASIQLTKQIAKVLF